jgi:hypothetical protein
MQISLRKLQDPKGWAANDITAIQERVVEAKENKLSVQFSTWSTLYEALGSSAEHMEEDYSTITNHKGRPHRLLESKNKQRSSVAHTQHWPVVCTRAR